MKRKTKSSKNLSRREFLKKGTQLGVATAALGSGLISATPPAWAVKSLKGTGEVIICAWGGGFQDAMRKTIFEPFTKETGIKVIDTSTPSAASIKAQVDSKNPEWDVALLQYQSGITLGEKYLEKIDYGYFRDEDYKNIEKSVRAPLTCGAYFFSYVICYNEAKFPKDGYPKSWADFINFERFPGKRIFSSAVGEDHFHIEAAQFGMGVPRNKLFPPDMKKAWAFYDKLKPHCIKWWDMGVTTGEMLTRGEIDVGSGYNARIQLLMDKGSPIKFTWNEGEMNENSYAVVKGAKNATNGMKLIAFACRAEVQAELANLFPYGGSNLAAVKYVKPEIKPKMNTTPENFQKQVVINWDWQLSKTLDPTGQKTNKEYTGEQWQEWALK